MDLSLLPEANWVDIIVLIFLVRGAYIGLSRGLSVELFKLVGAILTVVLSLLWYDILGGWLAAHSFLPLQVANFISFIILLTILLILSKSLRVFLFTVLHLELFCGLEKWGGFVMGLVRSTVFASLFLFVLNLLPVGYFQESMNEKSLFTPYLQPVAPKILEFITMFRPKAPEE